MLDVHMILSPDDVTVIIASLASTHAAGRSERGAPPTLVQEVASVCRRVLEAAFTMDELYIMAYVEGRLLPLRSMIEASTRRAIERGR